MIRENKTLNMRKIKLRRIQERRKIHFPFNSEGWVKALERKKKYVLWPVIDRRLTDRRNGERRAINRRLVKKHIRDNAVLKKEEIDYIFKLLSKSSKVNATVDL
jgi:hypothetical protein